MQCSIKVSGKGSSHGVCYFCHKKEDSKTFCEQEHYVCNECHTKGVDAIYKFCLDEISKNPIEIL